MPLFERHRFITIPPRGGSSVLCAITAAAAALLLASLTNYLYDGELLKVCVARPLGFANGNWGITKDPSKNLYPIDLSLWYSEMAAICSF